MAPPSKEYIVGKAQLQIAAPGPKTETPYTIHCQIVTIAISLYAIIVAA